MTSDGTLAGLAIRGRQPSILWDIMSLLNLKQFAYLSQIVVKLMFFMMDCGEIYTDTWIYWKDWICWNWKIVLYYIRNNTQLHIIYRKHKWCMLLVIMDINSNDIVLHIIAQLILTWNNHTWIILEWLHTIFVWITWE